MHIKKLEIFGFKSFANRQCLSFGTGITCVVGPNGCGKSNVVDALRWVLGEQNARHLRGGTMQDIIFCGSSKKGALGFAEVILTIDNEAHDAPLDFNHFTEIEITRRLYKSGESEYEINRQKARLRDISDFFLGTGVGTKAYSIIEQGRVNDIVSAKPADRRLIIEEAAGITKYKAKKAAAERRMDATRTNLHRITDIKNEVDKQVAIIEKEKEKLLKVQGIKASIQAIDLHIATHRYLDLSSRYSFLAITQEQVKNVIRENERSMAAAEQSFSRILEDYATKHDKKQLLLDLEGQHQKTFLLLEKDLDYSKTTLNDNRQLVTRINAQLDDIEARKTELSLDLEKSARDSGILQAQSESISAELKAKIEAGANVVERRLQNQNQEQKTQKKIIETATTAARLQAEINALREADAQKIVAIKNLAAELAIKEEEAKQIAERLAAFSSEIEHAITKRTNLKAALFEADKIIEHAQAYDQTVKTKRQAAEKEKLSQTLRLTSLRDIDAGLEWSESGVSELVKSKNRHLVKAVIADVIKVKSDDEEKVEKCLQHLLDAAVLADRRDLSLVADFLKKKQTRTSAFFVLSDQEGLPNFTRPLGLKCLNDFVNVEDPRFAPLAVQFSRYFLADGLSQALDHWPAARIACATILTEEGELLLPDGRAVILGKDNGKGVLKRKNEIAQLTNSLETLSTELTKLDLLTKESQANLDLFARKKSNLMDELKPLNFGIVRLEETLKLKNIELTKIKGEISKISERHEALVKTATNSDEKRDILEKLCRESLDAHKDHEEMLQKIRSERVSMDAAYEAYHQEIKLVEIKKASIIEKQKSIKNAAEQAQKSLDHLINQELGFASQIEDLEKEDLKLRESQRQSETKLKALQEELGNIAGMLSSLSKACEDALSLKEREELALASLKSLGRAHADTLHKQELLINDVRHEMTNLCDRIRDRYHRNLLEHLIDFHDQPLDEITAKKESESLRRALDRMGSVNENAALEFDELSKRADFLKLQVDDLGDALTQLETAIKKINKTTSMRFLEAFNNINRQFSEVFPRLFNGGKAELILCDQEDLLNCGVEIIAKPPGKNIGTIDLMSGGEKALTAISLIMAIFLIKPSPFCVLDEVDAPLDEANVARFGQLVKEMSQLSQFIVITHNRKTMESADQLYGVTMEEAGMSKIVSVHVQQAFDAFKQTPTQKEKAEQFYLDG